MAVAREEHRVGLRYVDEVTRLLQRVRRAHPTKGLYEAADLQWWWRTPRATDDVPQLFWIDDAGCPEAAAITVAWGDGTAIVPIVLPDATFEWMAHVVGRGLAHAAACGFGAVDLEVDVDDHALRQVLATHGYLPHDDGTGAAAASSSVVEAWLAADRRPAVAALRDGYRLCTRADAMSRPHHLTERSGPDVEARLRQTSLYRPDLDLLVVDGHGDAAAYGLFWFDPATATGLVEPMRTEDDHQGRGLARHVLTAGIDRLARAGAERVKICFEPDNPAAKHLYLDVGFRATTRTAVFSRPAGADHER